MRSAFCFAYPKRITQHSSTHGSTAVDATARLRRQQSILFYISGNNCCRSGQRSAPQSHSRQNNTCTGTCIRVILMHEHAAETCCPNDICAVLGTGRSPLGSRSHDTRQLIRMSCPRFGLFSGHCYDIFRILSSHLRSMYTYR